MDDVEPAEIVSGLVVVSSRLTRALRRTIGNDTELVTLRALSVIEQYQPVRVGHFAQGYLCSQPAATKLLARLEGAGLVVREAIASDRRASQFSLTGAGRARLAENRNIMVDQMEPYFESLSPEERVSVHRALGLVAQYLRDQHPVDVDDGQSSPAEVGGRMPQKTVEGERVEGSPEADGLVAGGLEAGGLASGEHGGSS